MSLEPKFTEKHPVKDLPKDQKDPSKLKKLKQGEEKSQLARIYRIFSGKKFLKFKHQYPRMRQTEIINRIIREWQSLSMEEKLKLGETYNKKEMQDSDEDDDRSDLQQDLYSEEHKISDNQVPNKASTVKEEMLVHEKDTKEGNQNKMIKIKVEDSESSLISEEIKDQEDQDENKIGQNSQSSSPINKISRQKIKKEIGVKPKHQRLKKNKPIKKPEDYIKLKNGEYILFYKHYFARLKSQHPKWSSTQLNHIIKLLWKKKQQQQKKLKKESIKIEQNLQVSEKPRKALSGKEYFIREKKKDGLNIQEIDYLWKQLPRESKADWKKRGSQLGMKSSQKDNNSASVIKCESSLKTQCGSKKAKSVISFKDALLKGIVSNQSPDTKSILEEKDETSKEQSNVKREKHLEKVEPQLQKQKHQNFEYVSLATNPLGFMRNKMNLEKIILE